MIHKFGNPAVTLAAHLRRKWGWPDEGLANPHNSAGMPRPMRDNTERMNFLASKYIPGNGKHHRLGKHRKFLGA